MAPLLLPLVSTWPQHYPQQLQCSGSIPLRGPPGCALSTVSAPLQGPAPQLQQGFQLPTLPTESSVSASGPMWRDSVWPLWRLFVLLAAWELPGTREPSPAEAASADSGGCVLAQPPALRIDSDRLARKARHGVADPGLAGSVSRQEAPYASAAAAGLLRCGAHWAQTRPQSPACTFKWNRGP